MLYFKRVDPNCREDIETLRSWDNDPKLSQTLRPNFDNKPFVDVTYEEEKAAFEKPARACFLFGESENGVEKPQHWLGYVEVQFSHPVMMGEKEHAGWIAVCVGDVKAQGKGYGKIAMNFIEKFSKSYGLNRLELGVFEFNERAIALYRSCGYVEIGRNENFAWHNGKQFTGIRMEKILKSK